MAIIGNFLANLPLVDPSWPHMTFSTSNVLRFGRRFFLHQLVAIMAFLSNLIPGWSRLTPAWPLTQTMHCTSVKGSFFHFLPSNFQNFDPSLKRVNPMRPLTPAMHYTPVLGVLPTKFGIHKAILPLGDPWPPDITTPSVTWFMHNVHNLQNKHWQ